MAHQLGSIPQAMDVLAALWPTYFPKEEFNPEDSRLGSVAVLLDSFEGNMETVCRALDNRRATLTLSVPDVINMVPFEDFLGILTDQPAEVIGCMGLAVSLMLFAHRVISRPTAYHMVLYNLGAPTSFHELKSHSVGHLVTVTGYVVRVSMARPLVTAGGFLCSKCGKYTRSCFSDGIFTPPSVCATDKCYNRYLELDRNTISITDFQQIKLQEIEERRGDTRSSTASASVQNMDPSLPPEDEEALNAVGGYNPRVPRTFDIEVRGGHLVDMCIAGDVLTCIGEVKMMQAEAPRGGRGRGAGGTERESGIHHIYVVANSIRTLRKDSQTTPAKVPQTMKRPLEAIAEDDNVPISDIYQATKLHKLNAIVDSDDASVSAIYDASKRMKTLCGDVSNLSEDMQLINNISGARKGTVPWLLNSLCPLIYGHELVKLGLLLGLFGGTPSDSSRGTVGGTAMPGSRNEEMSSTMGSSPFSTRSDIHVLVVGDPGLGKSQLLRAAADVAPKSVFVCGNTATTTGLTVSLSRDSSGSGRGGGGSDACIEAGALVLADKGVCCIDELDKMSCDPHSMLEAMEQQQISIAKSGVVTSLKSRTSILAAANPVGGHYNRNKSVCENLKMASALLSRFDLVFILLDRADEDHDRRISEHIMGITRASQMPVNASAAPTRMLPDGAEEVGIQTLSQRLRRECAQYSNSFPHLEPIAIRKYIEYARSNIFPKLSPDAAKVLQRMYLTMRSQGPGGDGADAASSGAMPVTTRHLESLIRLSQARARMDLRAVVTEADANDVVSLLQESILDTLTSESGVIDIGRKGGMSLAKQVKAVVSAMGRLVPSKGSNIFTQKEISEVYTSLRLPSLSSRGNKAATGQFRGVPQAGVSSMDVESIIEVMRSECYVICKGPRLYQLQMY